MIFTLVMLAITVVVLRPLIDSWRKLITTFKIIGGAPKTVTLWIAGCLLCVAAFGWLLMAFAVSGDLLHTLSPSGPAPFVLLPWFIGLCLYGLPAEFAHKLLIIVRGEDP